MSKARPNILLIVVDCLRADRSFGPKRSAQIPTLQSVAQRGAAFSHMITVNSVTIPCMTSVLSGAYPVSHGVRGMRGHRISQQFPLLAEILQASGYHTIAYVTSPLGPWARLDRGFDDYHLRKGGNHSFVGEWGDGFISRLRKRDLTDPWFIYLHLWEVHQPRQILPQFDNPDYGDTGYDRALSGVDARLSEMLAAVDDNTLIFVTGDHGEKIPDSRIEASIEQQKNFIKGIIGRLLPARQANRVVEAGMRTWYRTTDLLQRLGLTQTNLTALTGHGYHVYDVFVRVPLVVAGPGVASVEQTISEQVRQIDIYPTMLDLAGLTHMIPDTVEGRSLVPLLRGDELEPLPAFVENWAADQGIPPYYGVRTSDWKYAYNPEKAGRDEELYNLQQDPDETSNVASLEPDVIRQMRELAIQHFETPNPNQAKGEELTEEEFATLTKHLQELGYIE
jgi:arylsulfatase A-like enzyme